MPLQLWVQAARLGLRIKEVGVPRLYLDPNRAFGGVLNDADGAAGLLPPRDRRRAAERADPACAGWRWSAAGARSPQGELLGERAAGAAAPRQDGAVLAEPPLAEAGRPAAPQSPATARHADWTSWAVRLPSCAARPAQAAAGRRPRLPRRRPASRCRPIAPPILAGCSPAISRSCFIPASGSRTSPCNGLARATAARRSTWSSTTTRSKSTSLRCRHGRQPGEPEWIPPSIAGAVRPLAAARCPTRSDQVLDESAVRQLRRAGRRSPRPAGAFSRCCRSSGRRCSGRRADTLCWASASRRPGGPASGAGAATTWKCRSALLCRTEPFAWFACHLLADLPRFHAIYNDGVHEYRAALRHPQPQSSGAGSGRRGRLAGGAVLGLAGGPDAARPALRPAAAASGSSCASARNAWPALPLRGEPPWPWPPGGSCEQRGFKVRTPGPDDDAVRPAVPGRPVHPRHRRRQVRRADR